MTSFDKYSTRSPDYHYRQVNRNSLTEYNAAVDARFRTLVENVGKVVRARGEARLKLLDVGSGDGVALWLLRKKFPDLELYGIDPVPAALETARERVPEATFEEASAERLPFPDDFFDIIISSDVIEHVENPDTMLDEVSRVAKERADIIIGTPVRHSKTPLDHNHIQEFFAEDYVEMMKRHFRDVEFHETHHLGYFLLYNAPPRSFLNYRYFVNLLSLLFDWNPFRQGRKNRVEMFAYMYTLCKK